MTTFLLVRHAAHDRLGRFLDGRRAGVHLSEAGRAQAHALGERLTREAVTGVLTSPRERTRETADIIGRRLGLEPRVEAGLDEIDFGDWSGQSFEALASLESWRQWNATRSTAATPAGDTMRASQTRMLDTLDRAQRDGPAATVVVVGHADPIKAVIAYHLGLSLDHLGRFEVAPASLSRIDVDEWGANILGMNEVAPAIPGVSS